MCNMSNNQTRFYSGVFYGAVFCLIVYFLTVISYPFTKRSFSDYGELINKGVAGYPSIISAYQKSLLKHKQNVVFIFGTSETGGLATKPRSENYWRLLNRYYEDQYYFSTIGGAGHTPIMWANNLFYMAPDSKVYYMINPIYFTSSLNSDQSIVNYSKRYLTNDGWKNIQSFVKKNITDPSLRKFISELNIDGLPKKSYRKEVSFFLNATKENIHSIYTNNLESKFSPLSWEELVKKEIDEDWSASWNVASWIIEERDHSGQGSVKIVENFFESTRFKELLLIKEIAKLKRIDLNFILMPANEGYFQKHDSLYPSQYLELVGVIKDNLCNNNNCIDLVSKVNPDINSSNIFLDAMHFNSFGAAQIAMSVINHLER